MVVNLQRCNMIIVLCYSIFQQRPPWHTFGVSNRLQLTVRGLFDRKHLPFFFVTTKTRLRISMQPAQVSDLNDRPQMATTHMNLGAMLHYNGKLAEAEQSYLAALRLKPDDDVTQTNLRKLRNLMHMRPAR